MNLRIEDARGQCYDGAPSMKGANTGVAAQFKSLNGKMLYVRPWLKFSCQRFMYESKMFKRDI